MRGPAVFQGCGEAGDRSQHFFGDVSDDVLELASALFRKQRREARILDVTAEQGGDAGAGDAERKAGLIVIGQHEDVAEQLAHRAGLDLAAVGCARMAAFCVPIGEKLTARWMFHSLASPRPRFAGTHLSRSCAGAYPLVVVQDRLCSVHAVDAIWPRWRRLCVVNVKLTMGLVI